MKATTVRPDNGHLTYEKARGYHYWLCQLCGKLYRERIPDQAYQEAESYQADYWIDYFQPRKLVWYSRIWRDYAIRIRRKRVTKVDGYVHNAGNPLLAVCGQCNGGHDTGQVNLYPHSLKPEPLAEQDGNPLDYGKLEGRWGEFAKIAQRFGEKARQEDREDLTQDILVRLAELDQSQELSEQAQYRIASYVVMAYWRDLITRQVRVCVYSGYPKEPDNDRCRLKDKPSKCGDCSFLAKRPVVSLQTPVSDDGEETELWETIADDKAVDLECWLDTNTFLAGCPKRLVEVAQKRVEGKALNNADKLYLGRWRQKELKKAQKALF